MSKTLEVLLTENVEPLGIVGDVVHVKSGYARNYLFPRGYADFPSEEKIKELAARRAEAEKQMAELRAQRASMVERLEDHELTLERACNDQGLLYGSVTQQDIATVLEEQGFMIRARDVRLSHTIKRIDSYEILIKPDQDLEATIKLWVVADRKLDLDDEREEMEFDDEGNLIEKPEPKARPDAEAEAAESDADTKDEAGDTADA